MTVLRAQVEIPRDSGLPEDITVNGWYFEAPAGVGPTAVDTDAIRDALEAFYLAIDDWLSPNLNGLASVKFYNMADAEPRVPIDELPLTFVPAAVASLPAEVALCLSFRGSVVSGLDPAKRRGRVYIGPLNNLAGEDEAVTGISRPSLNFRTALRNAAAAIPDTLGDSGFQHAVYSPTLRASGASADLATTRVVHYWVDNAWDIQRRRGAAPSSRLTHDVA